MLDDNKEYELPQTFGETIYRHLKEAIITGKLRSETRLQERDIAKRFKVSATPVREAFRRLSAENYLTINARKEVIVVETSFEKIREIYLVLTTLDVLACERAIANLTGDQLQALEQMTEQLERYHREDSVEAYMKLDLKIHEKIWQTCGNEFLFQLLVDLGEKYAFYCNNVIASSDNPRSYLQIQDHVDMIRALRNGDGASLVSLVRAHWGRDVVGGE